MKTALILSLVLSFATAQAKKSEGPCKKLAAACKSAGFSKGGHKAGGKGLALDCMKPLLEGQAVAGVSVDAADVDACKAKKAERAARKNK